MTEATAQDKKTDIFDLDYETGTILGPLTKAQKDELVAARNKEHGSKLATADAEFEVVEDNIGHSAKVRVTEKPKGK